MFRYGLALPISIFLAGALNQLGKPPDVKLEGVFGGNPQSLADWLFVAFLLLILAIYQLIFGTFYVKLLERQSRVWRLSIHFGLSLIWVGVQMYRGTWANDAKMLSILILYHAIVLWLDRREPNLREKSEKRLRNQIDSSQ